MAILSEVAFTPFAMRRDICIVRLIVMLIVAWFNERDCMEMFRAVWLCLVRGSPPVYIFKLECFMC